LAILAYLLASGSVVGAAALLLALAVVAAALVLTLRGLGFDRDHPLVQSLSSRPWRDGRHVYRLALRHFCQVFIIAPNGSRLAPRAIEVCMNPADIRSLTDLIDLSMATEFAIEAYQAELTRYSARVVGNLPIEVDLCEVAEVPRGCYRIRQRRCGKGTSALANAASIGSSGRPTLFDDAPGYDWSIDDPDRGWQCGENPVLRLVTGPSIAETRTSGARAGRAQSADLMLPPETTISRMHATFTCEAGEWRIANLSRNGTAVNGVQLVGELTIHNGDSIRWGRQPDAPVSRVEIVR
jgi:hypothetical protein